MILKFLNAEGEASGYDFMKYCKRNGFSVSPGTIYPHLQSLEEEGYVRYEKRGKRKVYSLTAQGKKIVRNLNKSKEELERILQRLGLSMDYHRVPESIRHSFRNVFFAFKKVNWQSKKGIDDLINAVERLLGELRRWKDEGHSS